VLQQGAALCRLAVLARRLVADLTSSKQRCPDTSVLLKWNGWGPAIAAALSAATSWAEACRYQAYTDGADGSTGGSDGSAAGGSKQLMSRWRWQQLQRLQQAAFYLGKAAEATLLPAVADVDALKQRSAIDLLDSLAQLCGVDPKTLQVFVQVLPQLESI
jgi:hypothetical protein